MSTQVLTVVRRRWPISDIQPVTIQIWKSPASWMTPLTWLQVFSTLHGSWFADLVIVRVDSDKKASRRCAAVLFQRPSCTLTKLNLPTVYASYR